MFQNAAPPQRVIPAKAGIHHPSKTSTNDLNQQGKRQRSEMDPRLRGDDAGRVPTGIYAA